MEGPLAGPPKDATRDASPKEDAASKRAPKKSSHLMCGIPLWGISGAAASAYFSYLSYAHLSSGDYSFVHNWWTVLTYAVWTVVIGGLLTETACRRERIFFSLMLIIVMLGLVFSAWSNAPEHAVRQLRLASTALWALAALASLTTAFGSRNRTVTAQHDSPEGAK